RSTSFVIIFGGIVRCCLKCGDREYRQTTYDQVYDYALDLRNFQKESHNKLLVPIMISTKAPRYQNRLVEKERIIEPIRCNGNNIGIAIKYIADKYSEEKFDSIRGITPSFNERLGVLAP
ncbi:MAG: hypothetical protein LUI05_07675, partial [Oscillospiraceae bacterium]|nr:hypothetical protein [Oscillospiraceae bacterium]